MASWNEKNVGEELDECNICLCKVSKKRRTVHIANCYENYRDRLDTEEMGYLMRCPLYPMHIIPKAFLNHHLEFNCEEVQNLLRKYYQCENLRQNLDIPPPSFLADIPDEILNPSNKHLLYILKRDIDGKIWAAPNSQA